MFIHTKKIIKDVGKAADVAKPNIFSPQDLTMSGKSCMKDTDKIPDKSEEENQCCMSLKTNQPNNDLEFAPDKIKKRNSLPFPAASEAFYQKQGYLSQHNENRTKYRTNFPVQKKTKWKM